MSNFLDFDVDEIRGYRESKKFVCAECVDDLYLKDQIQRHVISSECSYCGQQFDYPVAASFNFLMEIVHSAFKLYFREIIRTNGIRDGFDLEAISTNKAFEFMDLSCHKGLYNDIENAFVYEEWGISSNGTGYTFHWHEVLGTAWNRFVETVKHHNRYFFGVSRPDEQKYETTLSPLDLLEEIDSYVAELGFFTTIKSGTTVFRVRERNEGDEWDANGSTMGAPPPQLAKSGRMNPAGISYFYAALDHKTAIAEIVKGPPAHLELARFFLRTDVLVLDLRPFEDLPSIFNADEKDRRERMLFLHGFFKDISKPISKDGREHIDYVPSQVACEYFSKVSRLELNGKSLAGILYPSAVRRGGTNLVLFPGHGEYPDPFKVVDFQNSVQLNLIDWEDIKANL